MTAAEADRYDAQRRPEFSTFGDAYRMRNKYPEAFAAGAQYALDRLLAHWREAPFDHFVEGLLTSMAARILASASDPDLREPSS